VPHRTVRAFPSQICHGARVAVRGRRALLAMLAIVLIAVGVVGATILTRRPDPKLDDFGDVGKFALVDDRGLPFTDDALRGHVTIVSFIFTRCDTICPATTMTMARVQEKTFDVGDRVKLLSFSVDPTYDTPERLAAYATKFRADPARWRFVTGPADAVEHVVEGTLGINMQRDAKDTPGGAPSIAHQGFLMLVDPRGHVRGHYPYGDVQELDEMIRDARFLARTMM
jgi:protein SCO1/2